MRRASLLIVTALASATVLAIAGGTTSAQQAKGRAKAARKAAKAAARAARVELIALQVVKPRPEEESKSGMMGGGMMMGPMGRTGTTLTVVVTSPARRIIGFDEKASRLASATDDKGTDLAKAPPNPRGAGGFSVSFGDGPFQSSGISEDGRSCQVGLFLPATPAPGAATIRLKGSLVLQCGSGEKTVEQKDVALKPGGKITAGPVPLTVQEPGQGGFISFSGPGDEPGKAQGMTLTLTHDKPLNVVKALEFVGPDGKPIKHQPAGSMSSGGFGGQMSYTTTYQLDRKVDRATVRITYYEKVEPQTVPLALDAGVGF